MTTVPVLNLLRAALRRRWLLWWHPDYVAARRRQRQGQCRQCGSCCQRTRPACPAFTGRRCRLGTAMPVHCRIFPVEPHDQAANLVGDGVCGYSWPFPDDPPRLVSLPVPDRFDLFAAVIIFLFIGFFAAGESSRFANYYLDLHLFSTDYGVLDEVSRNLLATGSTFTSYDGRSQLGEHFILLWYALAPLYFFGSGLKAYLIAKVVVIGGSGLPIYWLARRWLQSGWAALALLIAFFCSPPLLHPLTTSFNVELFAVPTFLFALYYGERRLWAGMLLFLFAAGCVKENYLLTVAMFGVCLFLRRERLLGAGVFFASVTAFLFISVLIIPSFNPLPIFPSTVELYGHFGSSLPEIARTLLLRPDQALRHIFLSFTPSFFFALLAPLLFLPFLAPRQLLLLIPVFLITHLSNNPAHRSLSLFYHTEYIPVLWVSALAGIRTVCARWRRPDSRPAIALALSVLVLVATLVSVARSQAAAPIQNRFGLPPANPDAPLLDRARALIPSAATAIASRGVCLHLPPPQRAYYPPLKLPPTHEFLLFYLDPETRASTDAVLALKHIADLTVRCGYGVSVAGDYVYLLQRGRPLSADGRIAFLEHLDRVLDRLWTGPLRQPSATRAQPFIISAELDPRHPGQREPICYQPARGLDLDILAATVFPRVGIRRAAYALNDPSFARPFSLLPHPVVELTDNWPLNTAAALPGTNWLYVLAETDTGDTLAARFSVFVDTTPPEITLAPAAAPAGKAAVSISVHDPLSTVVWWYAINTPDDLRWRNAFTGFLLNNYARRDYDCELVLPVPAAAAHCIFVTAIDAAGNRAQLEFRFRE